jgi:catechol 2,3-dioxygenase-like lactoylglutathione lyase family enzyme
MKRVPVPTAQPSSSPTMHAVSRLTRTLPLLLWIAIPAAAERPAIVGIANFVIKTNNIEDARKFYTGVLGYEEVFTHQRPGVSADIVVFKVNDRQYIEVTQALANASDDKLIQIGFETRDARKLRDYIEERGVATPPKVGRDGDGNLSFVVKDPEGHNVEFVEYLKGSKHSKNFGKSLSADRISDHIIHVGVHAKDAAAQDRFYKNVLGFRLQWKGGPQDDRIDWISLMVPDGNNWIEYMMWRDAPPDAKQLGVWHHVCVGTLDIQSVYKTVQERGYKPPREPRIGRDGRWLLQLFDKNDTRVEVMVRKPVERPCCSENLDPYVP